jgi:hypothetical protein
MSSAEFVVGYALNERKTRRFLKPTLVSLARYISYPILGICGLVTGLRVFCNALVDLIWDYALDLSVILLGSLHQEI